MGIVMGLLVVFVVLYILGTWSQIESIEARNKAEKENDSGND
jgi:hypothetical protein